MTNKEKKITKEQEARREREKLVADKIEGILVKDGFALQPFIAYSEYGIVPRVRLVENNSNTNGQGTSKGTAPAAGDTDKAS